MQARIPKRIDEGTSTGALHMKLTRINREILALQTEKAELLRLWALGRPSQQASGPSRQRVRDAQVVALELPQQ